MDLTVYFKPLPAPSTSSQSTKPSVPQNARTYPTPSPPSRDQPSHPSPSTRPRTLPPELTIDLIAQPHLHSFRRITSLLLPIRYPDKFYTDTLADPAVASLTRVALWRDRSRPGKRKRGTEGDDDAAETTEGSEQGKVVGGIRCRLEDVPAPVEGGRAERRVYVQTLCVLSPYRAIGVATALLEAVVQVGVRRWGITSVYAHVWEANAEALDWYRKRGFEVGELELGYYRRLKPAGARVVRKVLGVRDYLAAGVCRVHGNGSSAEGEGDVEEACPRDPDAGG